THTLYLTCDECTITLEDVALQLNLPVNEVVVTGAMVVPVIGVGASTIFMSPSGRPLYIPISDE
ncbi:hypothetical protein J1N35_014655, partial [Gossypium stocksii]